MSNFTRIESLILLSVLSSTDYRIARPAASHPPLTPTQSWTGGSFWRTIGATRLTAIFYVSLLKILPTTTGRILHIFPSEQSGWLQEDFEQLMALYH